MSAVNLCERCDALVLSRAVGVVSIRIAPTAGTNTMDLCPQCIEELQAFMQYAPKRDRGVFRNPFQEATPAAIESETPPREYREDPL